jgi:hypothetical protein
MRLFLSPGVAGPGFNMKNKAAAKLASMAKNARATRYDMGDIIP